MSFSRGLECELRGSVGPQHSQERAMTRRRADVDRVHWVFPTETGSGTTPRATVNAPPVDWRGVWRESSRRPKPPAAEPQPLRVRGSRPSATSTRGLDLELAKTSEPTVNDPSRGRPLLTLPRALHFCANIPPASPVGETFRCERFLKSGSLGLSIAIDAAPIPFTQSWAHS
jgi:hypothetical protein